MDDFPYIHDTNPSLDRFQNNLIHVKLPVEPLTELSKE